jgi:hypothetical protein
MFWSKESASLGVLLVQGAAVVWSPHATNRADERGVSKLDAERVIKGGAALPAWICRQMGKNAGSLPVRMRMGTPLLS